MHILLKVGFGKGKARMMEQVLMSIKLDDIYTLYRFSIKVNSPVFNKLL